MTNLHRDEGLDVALRRLPTAGPDPARSERVRARCHAAIARRYQPGLDEAADRSRRSRDRRGFGRRVLEPAAVAGFSLVYLSAIILDVLRLRNAL
jgi:hypothetical protein